LFHQDHQEQVLLLAEEQEGRTKKQKNEQVPWMEVEPTGALEVPPLAHCRSHSQKNKHRLERRLLQVAERDWRPPLGQHRLERRLLQDPERYWRPPLAQVLSEEVEAALDEEAPTEEEASHSVNLYKVR
jgi:hypothetical protein